MSQLYVGNLEERARSLGVEGVIAYLAYINLEEYVLEFKKNEIDGQILLEVIQNEGALKELGVMSVLHQIKIKTKLLEYVNTL